MERSHTATNSRFTFAIANNEALLRKAAGVVCNAALKTLLEFAAAKNAASCREEKGKRMKKEKIQNIKAECNRPKSELIRLYSKLQEVSPLQAEKLSKIIGRLEAWQNA